MSPTLRKIRWLIGLFIVGLALSGVTAFPLVTELRILCRLIGLGPGEVPFGHDGLAWWLLSVRYGLEQTQAAYPFIFYGTDWLAFAHLVIAVFFIGPWRDPVRNRWVLQAGLIACAGVILLALICGPIRGIPFYWRLIDCSFGVLGCVPLLLALLLTDPLERELNERGASRHPTPFPRSGIS